MALEASTYQYLNQLGLTREVLATSPTSVVSNWLVPANGWNNGQRFPYVVEEDLAAQGFEKTTVEGIEYFKVPEVSTNLPGLLSHYAQRTGVAELQNPPGGGANRVVDTLVDSHGVTVAPDAVKKYVEETDPVEEARKKVTEEEARVSRQINASPAREPAEGKLVVTDPDEPKSKPAPKKAATSDKASA